MEHPLRNTAAKNTKVALMAFPMHGQHKLSREGYRTRDGHFIEWFGRLLSDSGSTAVISRPRAPPHRCLAEGEKSGVGRQHGRNRLIHLGGAPDSRIGRRGGSTRFPGIRAWAQS